MLKKKVEEALNKQIAAEAHASSLYLAMSSWCAREGLHGCASFFCEQSAEEREHMLKLFKYVNESGGYALVPAVKEPAHSYKGVKPVIESALEHEQGVTKQINKLVELSLEVKDYATFNFLQWFVGEQVEEENLFQSVLDIIKLAGKDERTLFFVDKEINKVRGGGKC